MTKQSGTTIHDIAKALNIAASTVSRALNNNPLISEATRKRIEQTAQEMGYLPNSLAANLRTRRTNTIGVIVPLINRHFFSSVISGIEEVAYSQGFTVTISQSNDNFEKEATIANTLIANRVDGVIASLGMQTKDIGHFLQYQKRNIPLVFFDRVCDQIETDKIVVDDYTGGYIATRHLIDRGGSRIAHIGGPLNLKIYRDRMEGYRSALREAGLHCDSKFLLHNSLTLTDGTRAVERLFSGQQKPDALFCANDTTALSAILWFRKHGIKVPDDVLVVGFSNEPFSEVVTPSISTIRQPGFEMGQKAAELLMAQIHQNEAPRHYQTIIMPTELIIRESSTKRINNSN